MAATQNTGLISHSSGAGITVNTPPFAIAANVLYLAWIVTYNTTPANLATPAISGWTQVASVNTGTNRRLTLLRRMSATDVASAAQTITGNGLTQTEVVWEIWWYGGMATGGTNGANAIGQVDTNTSGAVNVTGLQIPASGTFAAFSSPKNGAAAAFQSSQSGAMAPRPGSWIEESDFAWTSGRLEIQFTAANADTVAVDTGTGLLMGIAVELVSAPDAIGIVATSSTTNFAFVFPLVGHPVPGPNNTEAFINVYMRPGCTYYIFLALGTGSGQGVTAVTDGHLGDIPWTQIVDFTFDTIAAPIKEMVCLRAVGPALEGSYTARLQSSMFASTVAYVVVEVTNLLAQIQVATRIDDTALLNPTVSAMVPCARRDNGVLVFWMTNGSFSPTVGWQSPIGIPGSPGGGWLYNCFWRANSDDAPGINMAAFRSGAIAIELQGQLPPTAPVVALVSPAVGAISYTASVVIDVTDVNGDLATFVPSFTLGAGAPEVAHDGTAFTGPYSGSSRSVITGGFQYTFVRTDGFTDPNLIFDGLAVDAGGLSGALHLVWTTDFAVPASNPPVITLISPPPGSLGRTEQIVVDVTDPDNDLATFLPIFTTPSGAELAHNFATPAFLGPYAAGSSRSVIANGFQYIFDRGGWPGATLSLQGTAYDADGNSTVQTYSWTVTTVSAGGSPPAALPADVQRLFGVDIWFDVTAAAGADRIVAPHGDWRLVGGPEAVKQSQKRRIITNPGDWATKPDYGWGARLFIKAKNTKANRDALLNRGRAQTLADKRVLRIDDLRLEQMQEAAFLVRLAYTLRGEAVLNTPQILTQEVR